MATRSWQEMAMQRVEAAAGPPLGDGLHLLSAASCRMPPGPIWHCCNVGILYLIVVCMAWHGMASGEAVSAVGLCGGASHCFGGCL